MKHYTHNMLNQLLAVFVGVFFLYSCEPNAFGSRPEGEPPPQTEVLRFELTPDTVATEDTVLIHCVIVDSLDERFEFRWRLEDDQTLPVDGTKKGPKIKWVAPNFDAPAGQVEIFNRTVTIDNGSVDSLEVDETFEISVIKQ